MAGHTVALYLHEQGHRVLGFDRKKSPYTKLCECYVSVVNKTVWNKKEAPQ